MKALMKMVTIESKLAFRNFSFIFFCLVFPPMMLLLMGGIYGSEVINDAGQTVIDMMAPSFIIMVVAVSGIMSLPIQLSEYRQRKVLKRFKAAPITKSMIMLPHLIVNFVLSMLGIAILLCVGFLFLKLKFYGNVLLFIFALILSLTTVFAIGFLISGIAKNSRAANSLSFIVYFPFIFLSGATMPLDVMPASIVNISKFVPTTYCVRLLKGLWLNQPLSDFKTEIILLSIITVLGSTLAIKIFKWE